MSFQQAVIDRSHEVPVVVDFWAAWCGPCQVLGPVMEELAQEANGKWELYKLNTEEDPETAQQYRIRGIPAVKLFVKGEVVAEFTGALPKHQIAHWLKEHLPDVRSEKLEKLLKEENLTELEQFVIENPDLHEAKLALAKAYVWQDPVKAQALLQELMGKANLLDQITDYRALVEMQLWEPAFDTPENLEPFFSKAQKSLKTQDFAVLLENLIESIIINKAYRNELARRGCIAIFHHLGEDHELTKKYRRRFTMALY